MVTVVAVINQKGGTGKTTLSTNLAYGLAGGATVALVDADAQGSASDWYAARANPVLGLDVLEVTDQSLVSRVSALSREYDWVIIDGPPGTSRTTVDAIRAADVVLIPLQASPLDFWSVQQIVEGIRARQQISAGQPSAAFVITRSRPRTRLGQQVGDALSGYGLPSLEARTTERVSYPVAISEGRSVLESRDDRAAQEILEIISELEAFCHDHLSSEE